MNVKNLVFFDNSGYNLNFEWNNSLKLWEGNIYFPKVSVGLYSNTNIYIMEKITEGSDSDIEEYYYFPQKDESDNTLTFSWDILNTFVDEFFMFDFDTTYYALHDYETSALEYTPNNGPELETLIVKTFDKYEVELDDNFSTKALPLHIAFSSPAKFDATTFKRTLDISYGSRKIARITFFAETIEEDERLKVLNKNLGYNIKPEDTIIFKDADIKEIYPDYKLLNEKRKELMIDGHNIYPYIGSYKAIINVIKYFGYENLNIIEYWRNVDFQSENFGKIFATSKYKLTNKETINVSGKIIPIPNKNYRKLNNISLVYTINHPTKEFDYLELPLVKEDFDFTMEEVLIKLFTLRRKLNAEFMPSSSRIVDIIGEGYYFGLEDVINNAVTPDDEKTFEKKRLHHPSISIFPSTKVFTPKTKEVDFVDSDSEHFDYVEDLTENLPDGFEFNTCTTNITDNRQFRQYAIEQYYDIEIEPNFYKINLETPISNVGDVPIESVEEEYLGGDSDSDILNNIYSFENIPIVNDISDDESDSEYFKKGLTDYYEEYYNKVMSGELPEIEFEPNFHDDEMDIKPSAKVILENTSFDTVKFRQILDTFGDSNLNGMTFGNIDTTYYGFEEIRWVVKTSENQDDEDLKKIGVNYTFEARDFTFDTNFQSIYDFRKILVELPFVGYYDVEMTFKNDDGTVKYIFEKAIKVEPYNLDIRGFYYDARSLPEDLQYDFKSYDIEVVDGSDSDITNDYIDFIRRRLTDMSNFALTERLYETDRDKSMPLYGIDDDGLRYTINSGPYGGGYINESWYLLDNLNYDITSLNPELNIESARYIKNAVDVKPYTWFLLGFDESKITSVVNPKWKLTNLTRGESVEHEGRYFTLLLKKEGDYMIELSLEDTNGNKYSTKRNIIIVDKDANYKLYKLFKEDYDASVKENEQRDAMFYQNLARLSTSMTIDDE